MFVHAYNTARGFADWYLVRTFGVVIGLLFSLDAQGTAADIMKTAMVLVARRLDAWRSSLDEGLDCPRLIMQVRRAAIEINPGNLHPGMFSST